MGGGRHRPERGRGPGLAGPPGRAGNIQEAIEAPRVCVYRDRLLDVQARIPEAVRASLAAREHQSCTSWATPFSSGLRYSSIRAVGRSTSTIPHPEAEREGSRRGRGARREVLSGGGGRGLMEKHEKMAWMLRAFPAA